MDRRSWPWKKKSSDKASTEKAVAALEANSASISSAASQANQDSYKKPNYVQISVDQYTHLTGLEDQIRMYGDQIETLESEIDVLNEKLSAADTEMTNKENIVKQHAKVAEEAVSGWEKAEAEALALKDLLESITLQKLTAEDRSSHLDGALKECMRQIRNLKEEHEQNLHNLAQTKSNQLEKVKLEFESRISNLDQKLLKSAAENAALSRSLHERSNMLVKISEEKSQAEAEIEQIRSNLESCEREINSFKYELHIASKELEIRTEEKNMSVRSADVANKQHLEGVKKIAKLEAECQRLRGLVRKKLPGPAALAQMKLEVESLGRDYGETRTRRSPVKPPSPSSLPEFSIDGLQKFQKENEFLTERLFAMEEETKMLKEALANRNSELQASRNICAKTAKKLQTLEAEFQNKSASISRNSISNPPSLTSMSENGNDDSTTCAESWPATFSSDNKADNGNQLELMDDFLEMEKLAYQSNESDIVSISESSTKNIAEVVSQECPNVEISPDSISKKDPLPLSKLHSQVSDIYDSLSKESITDNIVYDIKRILQKAHEILHQHHQTCVFDGLHCSESSDPTCDIEKDILLNLDSKPVTKSNYINPDLDAAITQVHDFVLFLGKEATTVQNPSSDCNGLSEEIEEFSATCNKALSENISLMDFVVDLSHILSKASEVSFSVLGYKNKNIVGDVISSDCIDKVALPESKVVKSDSMEEMRYPNPENSDSSSDPEIPNSVPVYASCKCLSEEFENLKLEKEKIAGDLEDTNTRLEETEKLLEDFKSQLVSAQKSNSLAETQLKCMVESYRSLEARAEELEVEVKRLREKSVSLENELQEEKKNHQDTLAKCVDLQDQFQSSAAEADHKNKEERELSAAAEKLAECQETIFLLGRQLKAMRPQQEQHMHMLSPYSDRSQKGEEESSNNRSIFQDFDHTEMDGAGFTNLHMDIYNPTFSPSDNEPNLLLRSPINSKYTKHRPTLSSSSSSSSNPTPEKHSRGFTRFFSTKGKIDH